MCHFPFAESLLMFADLDGDGLINYKEFLRWLSNPDAHAAGQAVR